MGIDLRAQRFQLRARGQDLQVLLPALLVDLLFPQAVIIQHDGELAGKRVQERNVGAHELQVTDLGGDLDGTAHLASDTDGGVHSRPAVWRRGGR